MEMRHFRYSEFDCPGIAGSGEANMDRGFLEDLDEARDLAKVPFVITSGYRTENYNRQIGGVENSAHTKGLAADIKADHMDRRTRNLVIMCLAAAGFRRIGEASEFIHVDDDHGKPLPSCWVYGQNEFHKA